MSKSVGEVGSWGAALEDRAKNVVLVSCERKQLDSFKQGSGVIGLYLALWKRLVGESGSRRSSEEAPAASRSEMMGPAVSAVVVRNGEQWLDVGHILG